MDTQRMLLAIALSFAILIGWQYLFGGFEAPPEEQEAVIQEQSATVQPTPSTGDAVTPEVQAVPVQQPAVSARPAKDITVETDLFKAVFSEHGGAVTSFILKKYKEENSEDSPGKQLVMTDGTAGFPLKFSWGTLVPQDTLYTASTDNIQVDRTEQKLFLTAAGAGVTVTREYDFSPDNYLITMLVKVKNTSSQVLQGQAAIHQVNAPFQPPKGTNRFLFNGPALYLDAELQEVKSDEFEDGPKTMQGNIGWAGYQGTYFACNIVPDISAGASYTMEGTEELARTSLSGPLDSLQPGEEKTYTYRIFYGPKKNTLLEAVGYDLEKAINFGWFDVIAKPTLWLLNFFYTYVKNYGIAIILVTVIFKAIFWPITQKGLKSMKNMQKLQPKMVKIKEKYKDDPTKMNQEVMSLYKTYKVNPLGGCLPMVLQIPVFFALYKVLLQSIELRHAPFMLWITDLSAPDRLMIGFDIPMLGGIPVLTLLMGASMFLQQKMTPTTADPTQAKIMMFLPLIFTVMFVNFASGLVLYWFINNLLSILQQQLINRQSKSAA